MRFCSLAMKCHKSFKVSDFRYTGFFYFSYLSMPKPIRADLEEILSLNSYYRKHPVKKSNKFILWMVISLSSLCKASTTQPPTNSSRKETYLGNHLTPCRHFDAAHGNNISNYFIYVHEGKAR